MRLSSIFVTGLTFALAAGLSLLVAQFSVGLIEDRSEMQVRSALDAADKPWAEVQADGLTVTLAGLAPTEAERFAALSTAGTVVDAARVIDDMEVVAVAALAPPRFSAEILRNDAGISIIGLMPASTDRAEIADRFDAMSGGDVPVTDLIETADYPAPRGWSDALGFALTAMEALPRAKVSVSPGRVAITAITDSAEEKARLEARLTRAAPPGLRLSMDIAAPRPVITPFTLRFVMDDEGARFDACSADSERSRQRIVSAAFAAGLTGQGRCTVGMGVPSPRWSEAVATAIAALADLGAGSVTFSDADITLTAQAGTDQATFDRVVGELEAALPRVFAVYAVLPAEVDPNAGPPEFTATLSPEGQVQLRGRLSDPGLRTVADSYAKSRFGVGNVYTAARVVDDLPATWPVRVLAGLEALSNLSNGVVRVTPDVIDVSGNTGDTETASRIATLLADKLGEAEAFEIDVAYLEKLDPVANIPTPDECEREIGSILAAKKINFEPGSATIDASTLDTMDQVAEVLIACGTLRLEIQGHTDSQGREEMNRNLSQARAQSVLNELRARRVPTTSFVAKGYGESRPIQPNDTEEGREANRRIEFRLIRPEPSAITQPESALESLAESADTEAEAASDTEGAGAEDTE